MILEIILGLVIILISLFSGFILIGLIISLTESLKKINNIKWILGWILAISILLTISYLIGNLVLNPPINYSNFTK